MTKNNECALIALGQKKPLKPICPFKVFLDCECYSGAELTNIDKKTVEELAVAYYLHAQEMYQEGKCDQENFQFLKDKIGSILREIRK